MDAEELFDGSCPKPFADYHDLKGKNVFITGGGSGIGAYFVSAFAMAGANVGFLSLSAGPAGVLCDLIEQHVGARPFYRACDIRDTASLQQVLEDFSEQVGECDVLINNAARDDRASIDELSPEQLDDVFQTNLKPYFFSIQALLDGMRRRGAGSIINISSNAPQLGVPGFPAYVASKAAISGMSKSLARELGDQGIRVNSILPGWCLTERQKRLWLTDDGREQTLNKQAIKRMLTGVDLASAALFLASDASSMVTGTSMFVDGGIS